MTKFTAELTGGLSKPVRVLVGEMLSGIQARHEMELSDIARGLDEGIPLIETEDRLSCNLRVKALEGQRSDRSRELGSQLVEARTV